MTEDVVTSLKMRRDLRELILLVSKNRSETMATFIKRSVLKELASLGFLNADQKKSLGVTTENNTPEAALHE